MARKISELPLTDTADDADLLPIVQGGSTKRIAVSDLLISSNSNVADDIAKSGGSGTAIDRVHGIRGISIDGTDGAAPDIGDTLVYNAQGGSSYKQKKPTPPKWFHAEDYGVSPGNSGAVNSAALQSLIDTATATPGEAVVIYMPEKEVALAEDLTLTRAVRISGVAGGDIAFPSVTDYNGSSIRFAAGKGVVMRGSVNGMSVIGGLCDGAVIENLAIYGTSIYSTLAVWGTGASKSLGDRVKGRHVSAGNIRENRYYFECIKAGVTDGSTEPDWQSGYIVDRSVLWSTLPATTNAVRLGTVVRNMSSSTTVYFECTTSGTKGGVEPTWDTTPGNTTSDGSVVWTARSAAGYWITDGTVVWACRVHAGVYIESPRCRVQDCRITGFTNSGIHVQGGSNLTPITNANMVRVRDTTIEGCGAGISIRGADGNAGMFDHIRVTNIGAEWDGTGGTGIWDGSFLGNNFFSCLVEACSGAGYLSGRYDYAGSTNPLGGNFFGCYLEADCLPPRGWRGLVFGGNWGQAWTLAGITILASPEQGTVGLYAQDATGAKHGYYYLDSQGSDGFGWHANDDNTTPTTWFGTQYESASLGRTGWWSQTHGGSTPGRAYSGATAAEGRGWDWQPFGEFKGGKVGSFGGQYFHAYDIGAINSSRVRKIGQWNVGDRISTSSGDWVISVAGYRGTAWTADTAVQSVDQISIFEPTVNEYPIPTPGRQVWKCTTTGTTAPVTEPAWPASPTPGVTTYDEHFADGVSGAAPAGGAGTCIWTYLGTVPEYQVYGGEYNAGFHKEHVLAGRIQTASTSPTNLYGASFTMADETCCTFHFKVTMARRTNVTKAGVYEGRVTYRRTGGGAPTIVGSATYDPDQETTAGDGVLFDVTSNTITPQVTAADSDGRNWAGCMYVIEVTAS